MLIGISGKAGTGKDTAFKIISKHVDKPTVRRAFADPVKEYAEKYFSTVVDVYKKDRTTRAILQGIGHMVRERIDGDYWINQTLSHLPKDAIVVVTDVRYLNEALAVKKCGGLLLRLNGNTRLSGATAYHPSETQLDDFNQFDHIINNVGSLDDFEKELLEWIQSVIR